MATKDDNIKRLQALAVVLGRKVDISGSAAEIQQRLMEWEEEAAGLDDDDEERRSAVNSTGGNAGGEDSPPDWVVVRALKTLHIPALTLDGRTISDAVMAGAQVQIQARYFNELESAGLVCAV